MKLPFRTIAVSALLTLCLLTAFAQDSTIIRPRPIQPGVPVILSATELTRVVPPGFYFEGQSAPTQMRNAAAARFGKKHVIAGLVDTSGYSSEIRAKYEGFFITDGAIAVGTGALGAGAYGFGFTETGQFNVFDVGGNPLMSVGTSNEPVQLRPRPLMMSAEKDGLRLYSGRRYVLIAAQPAEVEL